MAAKTNQSSQRSRVGSLLSAATGAVGRVTGRGRTAATAEQSAERPTSKTDAKKSAAKKTTAKKSTAGSPAKATKSASGTSGVAKSTTAKKTAASQKSAPAKKAAKKTAAKKTAAKKAAPAKKTAPQAVARVAAKKAPATSTEQSTAKTAKTAKKAPPVKKATSAKKTAAAEPAPSTSAAKNVAPVKKSTPVTAKKAPVSTSTTTNNAGKNGKPSSASVANLVVREDESPWTAAELAEVRTELTGEIARFEDELKHIAADLADLVNDDNGGAGDDQADVGSKALEREYEYSLAQANQAAMDQAKRALARIDDGTYGICESCGNPIGKLRLQAYPRATLCVQCKAKQERR